MDSSKPSYWGRENRAVIVGPLIKKTKAEGIAPFCSPVGAQKQIYLI